MKKKTKLIAAEAGAGILTAAALAAAGVYWFSGKEGKKRREKAKAWSVKARKEIEKNLKSAKKLGAAEYARMVDQAMKRYGSLENVSAADIMEAAQSMKAEWKNIQAIAKKMGKGQKGSVKKKVARKSVRSTKKKTIKNK